MPLMTLEVAPRRKWRYWHWAAVSLALHSMLLGLGELYLSQVPEIRFFSPDNAVSVTLVASGDRQGKPEGEGATGQKAEAAPVKEVQSFPSAPRQASKGVRKKQASPRKTTVTPKKAAEEVQNPAPETEIVRGKDIFSPGSDAAVERTIGEGDAPSFARFVPPEYPHQARARNMEGRVLLRVLVGVEGRAKEIQVVESSHPAFTKAARTSAQRSRYVPLMLQSRAEEVWVLIPFQFTLR